MMARKAISAVLGGALALGSFLCLGMGMDMGTAWAPSKSHGCCPSQAPENPDSNCCLLMPGAMSAPVAVSVPVQLFFVLASAPAAVVVPAESRSVLVHGPPGHSGPGHAAPSAPRAPPVA
jgi:hypothetical protein